MRKKIVAGNWKMNLHDSEVTEFLVELDQESSAIAKDVELAIFPPAIYLDTLINFPNFDLKTGAQDCSSNDNGAYTGEISASMLQSLNNNDRLLYTLVGHSERRQYHNEKNELLALKVNQLLKNDISPIYCCGEALSERENNNHKKIVELQIKEGLFHLSEEEIKKVVIAYEPVWAIGTGVTASADQAQEMHSFIRDLIASKYSEDTANQLSILYGGSCKPSNAKELFAQKDIDGGLIGGASLKVESFIQIANSF